MTDSDEVQIGDIPSSLIAVGRVELWSQSREEEMAPFETFQAYGAE